MARVSVVALDLFAGTGWGVACQRLGIEEYGVEIMPEARAVRALNGMHTIYGDVWEGLIDDLIESRDGYAREAADDMLAKGFDPREVYDLLIASPPCQTFSMAGSGAGRRALDEVLAAIDERLYVDPEALRAFGDRHDPKTALVLTPLAHIYRDTPMYVVLEQVPPVLPVWERYAEEMRRWGYSVWTGNLQAEQYGVPQTRKRAILIARADGREAKAPTPTHSAYYSRDPQRLDPGVLPWVSMAKALGWDEHERIGFARRADDKGAATEDGYRERDLRPATSPAQHLTEKARSWKRSFQSNNNTSTTEERYERDVEAPSPTITAGSRSARWNDQSGTEFDPTWPERRPALTIAGRGLVPNPGHNASRFDNATKSRNDGLQVTIEEAATLQSYPADFRWDATFVNERGREQQITKTNTFLQIGNAVPPGLAEAVLREVLS